MAQNNGSSRFTDASEEPTTGLPPLEGYEELPLVSLTEAVAPIDTPVHKLDTLVWMAERNSQNPADGLTSAESASINLYTMEGPNDNDTFHTMLNKKLRSKKRHELRPWYSYLKLFLTALYKLPSLKTTVWRGVRGDISDLYENDFIWWGVSSCTEEMGVAENFVGRSGVRTLFMIECINGKSIKSHSIYPDENEILLIPTTYLRVIDKCRTADDLHIIRLREETPSHSLIASPLNSSQFSDTFSLEKITISNRDQSNRGAASAQSHDEKSVVPEPTEPEKDQNQMSQANKAASSRKTVNLRSTSNSAPTDAKRATTIHETQHTTVANNSASWKPHQGQMWEPLERIQPYNSLRSSEPPLDETVIEMVEQQPHSNISSPGEESVVSEPTEPEKDQNQKSQANKAASSRETVNSAPTAAKRTAPSRKSQPAAVSDNSASSKPRQGPDPEQCLTWSCEDVCTWIKSLNRSYATYVTLFQQRKVNGHYLLHSINNTTISQLGVKNVNDRRVILDAIEQLKTRRAAASPSNTTLDSDFYNEFEGDFVPSLQLSDTKYPNTLSCALKPQENQNHRKLYTKILKWIEPLPPNIDIDQIELIHNTKLYPMFLQQIKRTEESKTQQEFQPYLNEESNPTERKRVLDRLQTLTEHVHHNRAASIVRVWYACNRTDISKLLSDGFVALGESDKGFGTGMYFTSSAGYATTNNLKPNDCLVMCYVVLLNPFPVISDDAPPGVPKTKFRFYGNRNHSNYQCHYIPVAPIDDATSWNYLPPPRGVRYAACDEFVVFQEYDILPQVFVYLKPRSGSSAAASTSGANPSKKSLSTNKN